MLIDSNKIKAEIERLKEQIKGLEPHSDFRKGQITGYNQLLSFLGQEPEPKFSAGDMVVSTRNPHLTYRIMEVGLVNDYGNLEYKVEIFTDGKPGILHRPHNIHRIEIKKMDEWGALVPSPKIKGWVARNNAYLGEELVLITQSPYCDNTPVRVITDEKENSGYWDGRGYERDIPNLFPELTWESAPIEVELTIKKYENRNTD